MADIVNLRQRRKQKARETAAEVAAVNRAAFGRSKLERRSSADTLDRDRRKLDGLKRERQDDE